MKLKKLRSKRERVSLEDDIARWEAYIARNRARILIANLVEQRLREGGEGFSLKTLLKLSDIIEGEG